MTRQGPKSPACSDTRIPSREERRRFERMRIAEDVPHYAWLQEVIETSAWRNEAPRHTLRSFDAHHVSGFTDSHVHADVVAVHTASEDEKSHRSALFLVRYRQEHQRSQPVLATPPQPCWSASDGRFLRDLGVMIGDDGISVLYWEEILPSPPGRTPNRDRPPDVTPVGRFETQGYGWLAWFRNGRLVVRPRTCAVIPPV